MKYKKLKCSPAFLLMSTPVAAQCEHRTTLTARYITITPCALLLFKAVFPFLHCSLRIIANAPALVSAAIAAVGELRATTQADATGLCGCLSTFSIEERIVISQDFCIFSRVRRLHIFESLFLLPCFVSVKSLFVTEAVSMLSQVSLLRTRTLLNQFTRVSGLMKKKTPSFK